MYITPAQLADSPGALEIAQCLTPDGAPTLDAMTLDAVLRGGDTSEYDPKDVVLAQDVLALLLALIGNACQMMDGYIGKRYTLPFAHPLPILAVWACAIVRYHMHKDLSANEGVHPIVRDYRDAIAFLQQIAAGKFSLGAGDPTGPSGSGLAQVSAPRRVFNEATLRDFGSGL